MNGNEVQVPRKAVGEVNFSIYLSSRGSDWASDFTRHTWKSLSPEDFRLLHLLSTITTPLRLYGIATNTIVIKESYDQGSKNSISCNEEIAVMAGSKRNFLTFSESVSPALHHATTLTQNKETCKRIASSKSG